MPRQIGTVATTTALGSSATYTGGAIEVPSYIDRILVGAQADQTGNLFIEQSRNGTNWLTPAAIPLTANTYSQTEVRLVFPYVRLRYANGATAQGSFTLGYKLREG